MIERRGERAARCFDPIPSDEEGREGGKVF